MPCWPSACPGSACSSAGSSFQYPTGPEPAAGQHEASSSGPCTWIWQAGSQNSHSLWCSLCFPHGNEPSSSLLRMDDQGLRKKKKGLCVTWDQLCQSDQRSLPYSCHLCDVLCNKWSRRWDDRKQHSTLLLLNHVCGYMPMNTGTFKSRRGHWSPWSWSCWWLWAI